MKSRWSDDGAREALQRWGPAHGEDLALRVYTARLIGQEPDLVLHGGGNASVKGSRRDILAEPVEVIHVKASGRELAEIEPAGLPALELAPLRRLAALATLTDDEMVNQFRRCLLDTSAATPSIETLLHAFLPHRFVDHSHADAVLVLTNQAEPDRLIREALGTRVAVVPYVQPGFELAKTVVEAWQANASVDGVVLVKHGLVTFGDDARTSFERHIGIVEACERFIAEGTRASKECGTAANRGTATKCGTGFQPVEAPVENRCHTTSAAALAAKLAPILRGLLAIPSGNEDQPYQRSILEWRAGGDLLRRLEHPDAAKLAGTGPLTSDHLIRTKPWPLFIGDLEWSGSDLRGQLSAAMEEYRVRYRQYVGRHGGDADGLDASPKVILIPGAGALCWGHTKHDARIAADITEHTLAAQDQAQAIGGYESIGEEHLFAQEYRSLQLAKLPRVPARPLDGQVVVISGGAGAIGAGVADRCAQAGAHVVVADLDAERAWAVARRVEECHGPGTAAALAMDVTDEASVNAGFEEACRLFGGVDVIVPNAGVAHVSPIEDLSIHDFRRVMEVNVSGYLLFMQAGIRVLKRQGLGGHVVINSSKNVFGPGKDFGAYSASKAAGHQLGKVAAIELAPYGIRVNMINADAIFGDEGAPSGLWAEVGPQRATSRGLDVKDLPEYYRSRNLLKARVCGHHVGNAVVFFASNATPTTGATLPVDGGVVEAFPR